MAKAPAFQFYPSDFMQDTNILSLGATGAWIKCLCKMWAAQIRGELTFPMVGYARLFGSTVEQAEAVIGELEEMGIADVERHSDGKVTLVNRRMSRESKEREAANQRQQRYRDKRKRQGDGESDAERDGGSDAEVTPPSSYSSSPSGKNTDSEERGRDGPERAGYAKPRYTVPAKLDAPDFRAAYDRWLEHHAETSDRQHSLARIEEELTELAKMEPRKAVEAVKTAVGSGWHKLVYDFDRQKGQGQKRGSPQFDNENRTSGEITEW